ncbi:PREDICTED: olfactory receptor-like protein OLF3 [Hipposideros armiger]|uniref:Olfactory receptor n=1 Tax=Hipposideros armiger TaxID=186990 RepID=A0A8B7QJH4_HIPAR|nr:PREDICTED: olfactory receptor-like protein OLF3 [Hipposideros armiger]XP_019487829.1 PREDICTED: olfactory receptor-like protein OLF3 [Hipposideros armiger]XP_019487830.1 PREDICTED: olfactory receptor-like protein OLF3 [Hipposideros armiger]XP_019487831.1 PREDICTED: olfactory receptor-like protein OLF3 [Hipposideros armiger]
MKKDNLTWADEFVLLELSSDRQAQAGLFVLFGAAYLLTLLGNGFILLLIGLDARLHLPMYFFLCHLSLVDICYTSSAVPQMLVHFLLEKKTIPFARCAAQVFFSLAFGGTEFLLLAAMAYDRYVAVCDPLRYVTAMDPRCCIGLAAVSWLVGTANSVVETAITMHLPTCGHHVLNHVGCETLALIRLACVDVTLNQVVIFASSVLVLLVPCCLVSLSYARIVAAILRIRTTRGRRKAFGTCASHLSVVSMSYGMALVTYLHPRSTSSATQDKVVVLFYTVATPLLNPLIYSLRNKEMKAALSRVLMRSSGSKQRTGLCQKRASL